MRPGEETKWGRSKLPGGLWGSGMRVVKGGGLQGAGMVRAVESQQKGRNGMEDETPRVMSGSQPPQGQIGQRRRKTERIPFNQEEFLEWSYPPIDKDL